jgi:hypothetical protein
MVIFLFRGEKNHKFGVYKKTLFPVPMRLQYFCSALPPCLSDK